MITNTQIALLILAVLAIAAAVLAGVYIGAKIAAPEREYFTITKHSDDDMPVIEEPDNIVAMSARERARMLQDDEPGETIEPGEAEADDAEDGTPNDFRPA